MRILDATDGSRGALAAAELLAGLPLDLASQIFVLTVMPVDAEEQGREALSAAREVLRYSLAGLTTHIRRGEPAEVILRMAEEHAIDLVVVGTRGLSAIERFFLGSVAERVARHAACPVLLVRPHHDELRRIIVGVDGSRGAAQAVAWLQRLPLPVETEIRLVTVLPFHEDLVRTKMLLPLPVVGYNEAYAYAEQQLQEAQEQLDAMALPLKTQGKRVITDIKRGDAALALQEAGHDESADLLVVGSQGHSAIERFMMGSVSEKVLRHAHCSVLVVKQPVERQYRTAFASPVLAMAPQDA